MKFSAVLLSGLPAVLAAPLEGRTDYAVHSSHFVPPEWERIGAADPDHEIQLRIGLKQGSFDELERHLYEVSDPSHSRYGQHLSEDEVHELVAPPSHAISAVEDWLQEQGITRDRLAHSVPKDWIMVSLPVEKVESLLDTKYHEYQHTDGARVVRTTHYSLPRSLRDHIDIVAPTNYFGNPKHFESTAMIVGPAAEMRIADAQTPPVTPLCVEDAVTSQCVRTYYNTIDYTPKTAQKNYVATTNYLNQTPSDTDFREYMLTARPDANPSYIYSRQNVNGAFDDQTMPGAEANLDVQAVGGIAYPTRFTTYLTGGSPPFKPDLSTPTNTNEPYLTWVDFVTKQKDLPLVITTSYGDNEQTVPRDYATRVCAEFAKLGARGSTLLFSSGDSGVGQDGKCRSNDGKNTYKFLPTFPASCPYITTVGGTRGFNPEKVAFDTRNGYVAGGGFSEYFPRPAYQNNAVSGYLKSIGTLNKGLYNANGRAYPDIAAQGYAFVIILNGVPTLLDGTSVSSPVAAGVLTLVNDALLAAGKPPLGFLNPLLYAGNGAGFNDITTGSVTGCNSTGFPAKKGWDAASGFGSPDFKAIRAALKV